MDPLFQQAKSLYPNAPDEEIMQGIAQIRQEAPNASDEEILKSASAIKQSKDDGSFMKHMVNSDVKNKYGLDERKKIVDQNEKEASGPNWLAGLSAFGAGLGGGNAAQAAVAYKKGQQEERDKRLDAFDRDKKQYLFDRDDNLSQEKLAQEMDPNSEYSKIARELAISMGMSPDRAKDLTAAKFKDFSPALQKKYEIAQRSLDRKLMFADRKEAKDQRNEDRELARQDRLAKEAKPSDKQIEAFTDLDNAGSDLKNILGTLGSNKGWTGPVDGNIPNLLVGEDQAAWRSAIGKYKDAYRKAITGAGASASEMARLETRLPSETDTYETFVAKAKEAEKEIARRKEVLANNLTKGGKDVSKFRESQVPQMAQSSDYVRVRAPNGKPVRVRKDRLDAALKAGGQIIDESIAQKDEEMLNGGV